MKNTLALSILKVEGIGEQSGCYLIIDDKLIDVISIQDTRINENCTEIPLKGELKFIVKSISTSEKITCSISILIDALPSEGTVWLPLYSNSSNETLPQIPSTLPNTKILISVNQLSLLTPVPEMTEYDSSFFDIENSLCRSSTVKCIQESHEKCKKTLTVVNEKNKDLRGKIWELENKIQDISEEHVKEKKSILQINHESFSRIAIQLEKYKVQCINLQTVYDDKSKQLAALQILVKQEVLQREHIEKQLFWITKEFQQFAKVSDDKINFCKQELENKDKEIEMLKQFSNISESLASFFSEKNEQITNLQTQLHNTLENFEESEFQRKILQQKIETIGEFPGKDLEALLKIPPDTHEKEILEFNSEIKKYKQKCVELENLLDDRYVEIKIKESENLAKNLTESQTKILELTEETNTLKELLAQEKKNNTSLMQLLREKNCKELETKVKCADDKFIEYLKNFGIEDKFEKTSEGVFSYNGKKVSVAIKNGCLICRVGGSYMGIEKFMKSVAQDKEENTLLSHKRSLTAAVLKEKTTREETVSRSSDRKINLARIHLNSKENTEDTFRSPKIPANKLVSAKEKGFFPSKDLVCKKLYK